MLINVDLQCAYTRVGEFVTAYETDPRQLEYVNTLAGLVTGRGACAHPDGTARLVGSLLTTLEDHVEAHLDGECGCWSARDHDRRHQHREAVAR